MPDVQELLTLEQVLKTLAAKVVHASEAEYRHMVASIEAHFEQQTSAVKDELVGEPVKIDSETTPSDPTANA